jgi:hypothetical protein
MYPRGVYWADCYGKMKTSSGSVLSAPNNLHASMTTVFLITTHTWVDDFVLGCGHDVYDEPSEIQQAKQVPDLVTAYLIVFSFFKKV